VASAACSLRPTPLTKWLLRNRRQLGVSFAVSQLAHLAFIAVLVTSYGHSFWSRVALTTIAGGGVGYVFTAAMALTSFDRTAAWLGRARWKALHKAGMYVMFGIFLFTYAPRYTRPSYAAFTVLLLLALALRIVAKQRRARRAGYSAAHLK
jgi:methionine sulfoxide reductase heme-binding subunit